MHPTPEDDEVSVGDDGRPVRTDQDSHNLAAVEPAGKPQLVPKPSQAPTQPAVKGKIQPILSNPADQPELLKAIRRHPSNFRP